MSRVRQLQLQYHAREDRGLLRINTVDRCEYRFWMTRRFTRLLWPVLVRMLESTGAAARQRDPATRAAVLSFEHEKAVSGSDFATEYREDAEQSPLGTAPVLLARIEARPDAASGPRLALLPNEGRGLELVMDDKLLHAFCTLIEKTVQRAEWDLDVALAAPAAPAHAPPARLN